MKEETRGTKPFRSIVVAASVADPNEKEHIVSLLMSMPHSRSRMFAAALGVEVKKKKISNIRKWDLHRNLSERLSNESLG